jgi:ppGpp synthetase/RelA/SpoT-type nucleotidyltranferase
MEGEIKMEDIKTIVLKRINYIDLNTLCDVVDKLKLYNVNFYNNKGEFIYEKFKKDCIKTSKKLFKNDKPINGIRYQFCDFMSAIQTIVGIRNMCEFMGENTKLEDILEEIREL